MKPLKSLSRSEATNSTSLATYPTELALALSRYALHLFDAPESLTKEQFASLMETHGEQLRATFIARHGYPPEDSTTPYVPVTIEGPQDHDAYYAKEYP